MGHITGMKQKTLYLDPKLDEQVSHAAKLVNEPIYVFVSKALAVAVATRVTPKELAAIKVLTKRSKKL